MPTKTRRAASQEIVRALARLLAQARLNVGDSQSRGRTSEAEAWRHVTAFLTWACLEASSRGLPVQLSLYDGD